MISSNSTTQEKGLELSKYDVSYETGCMLKNPLKCLPPYFEPWNEVARCLPTLVKEKRVRETVDKMPLLDHTQLSGCHQLRLAHLQLSFITAGYVWQDGDKGVAKVLPRCVAVPFYRVSEILGVQPILSHLDLALSNYSVKDPNRPYDFDNLECLYHIPGDFSGDWFAIVTDMTEFSFTKGLKALVQLVDSLELVDSYGVGDSDEQAEMDAGITKCLLELSTTINTMQASLARMRDHLDARTFFNVIRPFLGGWGGEGNPLPDGLIYEGISESPIKMTGGSAAQITSLQVMDAVLGVEHTHEKREFLVHMRDHMPPDHRQLIQDLEQRPYKLRDFVSFSKNPALILAYNQCLAALIGLRDYHIQVVKKYIIVPSSKVNEGKFGSLDKKGTGGSSLIPFLKDIRADTANKMFPDESQKVSTFSSRNWVTGSTYTFLISAAALVAVGFATRALMRH